METQRTVEERGENSIIKTILFRLLSSVFTAELPEFELTGSLTGKISRNVTRENKFFHIFQTL